MLLTVSRPGAAAHQMDIETFIRHGLDPFVRHFEDPGPYVKGCPFAKDPEHHFHNTSPPRRLVLARSKIWSSKELDNLRRKVRIAGLVSVIMGKFALAADIMVVEEGLVMLVEEADVEEGEEEKGGEVAFEEQITLMAFLMTEK